MGEGRGWGWGRKHQKKGRFSISLLILFVFLFRGFLRSKRKQRRQHVHKKMLNRRFGQFIILVYIQTQDTSISFFVLLFLLVFPCSSIVGAEEFRCCCCCRRVIYIGIRSFKKEETQKHKAPVRNGMLMRIYTRRETTRPQQASTGIRSDPAQKNKQEQKKKKEKKTTKNLHPLLLRIPVIYQLII